MRLGLELVWTIDPQAARNAENVSSTGLLTIADSTTRKPKSNFELVDATLWPANHSLATST